MYSHSTLLIIFVVFLFSVFHTKTTMSLDLNSSFTSPSNDAFNGTIQTSFFTTESKIMDTKQDAENQDKKSNTDDFNDRSLVQMPTNKSYKLEANGGKPASQTKNEEIEKLNNSETKPANHVNIHPLGNVCKLNDFCPLDPEPTEHDSKPKNKNDKLTDVRPFDLHRVYHANKRLAMLDQHLIELQRLCPHLIGGLDLATVPSDKPLLLLAGGCEPAQLIRFVQVLKILREKFVSCLLCFEYSFKPLMCNFASQLVFISNHVLPRVSLPRTYAVPLLPPPGTFYADDAWQNLNELFYYHK